MGVIGSIAVDGGSLVLQTPVEMLCYEAMLVKTLVAVFSGAVAL